MEGGISIGNGILWVILRFGCMLLYTFLFGRFGLVFFGGSVAYF